MAITINIDVPDIVEGINFYTNALGMRLLRRLDDDVAELERGGDRFYLLKKVENTAFSQIENRAGGRNYSRHWTPIHIDFVVTNIDEAKRIALDAGAQCESDCIEWRGSRCITFADPFGHGFCLIEFSGDTYVDG